MAKGFFGLFRHGRKDEDDTGWDDPIDELSDGTEDDPFKDGPAGLYSDSPEGNADVNAPAAGNALNGASSGNLPFPVEDEEEPDPFPGTNDWKPDPFPGEEPEAEDTALSEKEQDRPYPIDENVSAELRTQITKVFETSDPESKMQINIGNVLIGVLQYKTFTVNDKIPAEDVPLQNKVAEIFDDLIHRASFSEKTVVTQETTFVGNIESNSPCLIAGTVTGNISTSSQAVVSGMVMGNITADKVMLTTGKAKGNIKCGHNFSMEPESAVFGDLSAEDVTISGSFEGDIDALGTVTLMPTAIIVGNIKARNMVIRDGAVFYGQCRQEYTSVDVDGCLNKIRGVFEEMLPAIEDKSASSGAGENEPENADVSMDGGSSANDVPAPEAQGGEDDSAEAAGRPEEQNETVGEEIKEEPLYSEPPVSSYESDGEESSQGITINVQDILSPKPHEKKGSDGAEPKGDLPSSEVRIDEVRISL